jgi:hypothetical protein
MDTNTVTKLCSDAAASASSPREAYAPIGRVFAIEATVPMSDTATVMWLRQAATAAAFRDLARSGTPR